MMLFRLAGVVLLVALLLGGCGGNEPPQTLTIFAAASLTDAFEELATAFEGNRAGVTVRFNFASSSALATQLIEGATGDVFASANAAQMQKVAAAGLLWGEARTFARNRLVVVVWKDSRVQSLDDLTGQGVKLVTAAPEVPIRHYTDQALAALAADKPGYAAAFVANVVSEEANVRAVVLKVSLGEADAGIVYASDLTPDIAGEVRIIPIPDAYNVLAEYPIATLNETKLAQDFMAFVLSAEGQAILSRWGFIATS